MGFFKQLFCKSKITSLGDGLNRVKTTMKVVGDNISTELGTRLYNTPNNNIVSIKSNGDALIIQKIIGPFNAFKNYIGKVAGFSRRYYAIELPNGKNVRQGAITQKSTFIPEGSLQPLETIPKTKDTFVNYHFNVKNSSRVKQDLAKPVKTMERRKVKRVLPYNDAISQGINIYPSPRI